MQRVKEIGRAEHSGFPLESCPPQGHVSIFYTDGTQETQVMSFEKLSKLLHSQKESWIERQIFVGDSTKEATRRAIDRLEHCGFPLESNPPQGHVEIYYNDGTQEWGLFNKRAVQNLIVTFDLRRQKTVIFHQPVA